MYYLENNNIRKISIKVVSDYILEQESKLSRRTVYNRKITLRSFLNWLYNKKIITFSGNAIFPVIHNVKSSALKSYYSSEEIGKIINSMPKKTKDDIRNYAIVVTFACLGMRSNDLIKLTSDNINWNDNMINYVQSKTNIEMLSTMPSILRYALLDYLKNARPNVESNYIFIDNNGEQLSSHAVYNITSKAILYLDDTNYRKHGSHVFRHSISTNMLKRSESISTISKVIGTTTETTSQDYIMYDEKILRNISLEVKEWN